METYDFWISRNYCNDPALLDQYKGACVCIKIPKRCNQCNKDLTISLSCVGSSDEESRFGLGGTCDHYRTYENCWANRIKTNGNNNLGGGAKCTECGLPNEYLSGPYVCSGCKLWKHVMS